MTNPLAPYFQRTPTVAELGALDGPALRRIIEAARDAESLNADDLNATRDWARAIREAAEAALAVRQ